MKLKVTVNSIPYEIEVEVAEEEKPAVGSIVIGGAGGMNTPVAATASVQATSANAVTAPLSGSVSRILVDEGDELGRLDHHRVDGEPGLEADLVEDAQVGRVGQRQGEPVAAPAQGHHLMLDHQLAVDGVDGQVADVVGRQVHDRRTEGLAGEARQIAGAHQPALDQLDEEVVGVGGRR